MSEWVCPECRGEFPDIEAYPFYDYDRPLDRCPWCGESMDGWDEMVERMEQDIEENELETDSERSPAKDFLAGVAAATIVLGVAGLILLSTGEVPL